MVTVFPGNWGITSIPKKLWAVKIAQKQYQQACGRLYNTDDDRASGGYFEHKLSVCIRVHSDPSYSILNYTPLLASQQESRKYSIGAVQAVSMYLGPLGGTSSALSHWRRSRPPLRGGDQATIGYVKTGGQDDRLKKLKAVAVVPPRPSTPLPVSNGK